MGAVYCAAKAVTLALAGALVALGLALGFRAWRRSRVSPEERERRRRAGTGGRRQDHGRPRWWRSARNVLFYSYTVRGVEYTACQDVTALLAYMPGDLGLGIGPVSVRYDARNPANSIVLAEDWSGLRLGRQG